MDTIFFCKHFNELSTKELHDLFQLRQRVFVVEQACPYLDADGKDVHAYHVLGHGSKGQLVCCSRLLDVGISYPDFVSIGRVVSDTLIRQQGIGKMLMQYSLDKLYQIYGHQPIKIGAQSYLKRFYEGFGFVDIGEPYLEDGIPHLIMVKE